MNTTTKNPANQAKEVAGQATEKAKDMLHQAGDAVQSAASTVGQKAEDATAAVGRGIEGVADRVRDSGPQQGMLGSATRTVADTLEGAGKYLEDKNLHGMVDDMTGLIKRNPIPAVLLGLGIGFLIGRALSSNSRSY
jgi:phage-related protein